MNRDERIRMMFGKKDDEMVSKLTTKLVGNNSYHKEVISNTYGITDPNLCPQISEGEKYITSLPKHVQAQIKSYTGAGAFELNRILRTSSHLQEDTRRRADVLDIAFRHCPMLTSPMVVYRGIRGVDLRDDNGFSSCSLNKKISDGFGGGTSNKITLAIGSKVLFVKPISACPHEDEVIVSRGGSFRELVTKGEFVYLID